MYAGATSIPYSQVTSIHYQTFSKKYNAWKIDVNNLSVRSLQGLLSLFLDKQDYNSSIRKILITINGMPHQLFKAGLQVKDIYPELKKIFLQRKLWCDMGRVSYD